MYVSAVEIVNGQILSKMGGEAEEKWNAWTPSPYQLNVSETYSMLSLYSGPSHAELSSLAHAPLRPVRDCQSLSSIMANGGMGQSLDGTHVSLLAAVRSVSLVCDVNRRYLTGTQKKTCYIFTSWKFGSSKCPSSECHITLSCC